MSRLLIVANRLPVDLERLPDGTERWKHSPGGLVSALEPFLRSHSGAWVGWPGVADADVAPFEDDGLLLHPVQLSAKDVEDYYEGFSNGTLWPLYHDVVAQPAFHRHWWNSYRQVNQRFADATAKIFNDKGPKIVMKFDEAGAGLRIRDGDRLDEFAIAGADHKWYWANAKITGKDAIEVWSDAVPQPVAVRYAFNNNPRHPNLTNDTGLPAAPFRTDNWPGPTDGKK